MFKEKKKKKKKKRREKPIFFPYNKFENKK